MFFSVFDKRKSGPWNWFQIGFDWLCFFAASTRHDIRKPLLMLLLRQFALRKIGFVF